MKKSIFFVLTLTILFTSMFSINYFTSFANEILQNYYNRPEYETDLKAGSDSAGNHPLKDFKVFEI